MNNTKLGHGVVVPMVTPVTSDHQIDLAGVANLVDHIISAGAAPFILGTTGESASIAEDDRLGFVNKMVEVANGRSYTYAGVSSPCLKTSVQAANKYFDSGVDAVVAHPPAYYQLSDDQLMIYFETLADSISGPVILYNITSVTHISIPISIIDKLSHHPKIIGLKDSERDINRFEEALRLWSKRDDFTHMVGWGAQMANGLNLGSNGLVPSTGNLTPREYVDMMTAVKENDQARLDELQDLLSDIGAIYQKNRSLGDSLAALKVMLKQFNLCDIYMMPPLNQLGDAEEEKIISGMKKMNLIN